MICERTYRGAGEGRGRSSSAAVNISVLYSQPETMVEGSPIICGVAEDGPTPTGVVVEGSDDSASVAAKGSFSKGFSKELIVDKGSLVDGPDGCIPLADKGSFSKESLKDGLVADEGSFASRGFFLNDKPVRSFGIVCSGFGLGATEGPDPAAIRCFVDRVLPD